MNNYFDEVAKVWNTEGERKNRTFTIYNVKYLGKNLKKGS